MVIPRRIGRNNSTNELSSAKHWYQTLGDNNSDPDLQDGIQLKKTLSPRVETVAPIRSTNASTVVLILRGENVHSLDEVLCTPVAITKGEDELLEAHRKGDLLQATDWLVTGST